MAHPQTDIPWDKLVSNLAWSANNPDKNPDICLLSKPTTEADISHFITACVEEIQKASQPGNRKTPSYETSPEWEDIVITDAIVNRIAPTVRRTLNDIEFYFGDEYKGCKELIPRQEREAMAFLRPYTPDYDYRGHANIKGYPVAPDAAFYNTELVKVLLLHGEMDAIIWACEEKGFIDIKWWAILRDSLDKPIVGWDYIYRAALRVFIGLQTLRRIMSSAKPPRETRGYRETRAYQYLLRSCTITTPVSRVATHPHRDFFGIADGQFNMSRAVRDPETVRLVDPTEYGVLPFDEFLAIDEPVGYIPRARDVRAVRLLLGAKGLPMELVLCIMDFAAYVPGAKLLVFHDPLHYLNRRVLEKHLGYCWDLLVRCDILGRTWRYDVDWEAAVRTTVMELFTPDAESRSFT